MNITKETICCISIAERPGNFGATMMNAAFEALGLNYIYKPFRVSPLGLEYAIRGIRAFGIRGCGVTMPHKTKVLQYLDKIDDAAKRIGAVNTIVNDGGVLTGYNTDYEGTKRALNEAYDVKGKCALIVGAGGVARAVIVALKDSGADTIFLTNRDEQRGKKLAKEFSIQYVPFSKRSKSSANLFINATPVGMSPNSNEIVIDIDSLVKYNACMDLVVSCNKTALIQAMEGLNKTAIQGFTMATYQGVAQFKLYTGHDAPLVVIEKAIHSYLLS